MDESHMETWEVQPIKDGAQEIRIQANIGEDVYTKKPILATVAIVPMSYEMKGGLGGPIKPTNEALAKACLIAAAPEMYKALEDAQMRLDKIANALNGELTAEEKFKAYSLAYSGKQREALVKARGEVIA